MKKIVLALIGLYLNFNLFAQFSGGTGTTTDPYIIATQTDLKTLSENSSYWGSGFAFKQAADIKFNSSDFQNGGNFYNGGQGFIPIGSGSVAFSAAYDGQGFKIDSIYINRPSQNYVGLFGNTVGSNSLTRIRVTNCNIIGGNNTGGLVGYNMINISNSSVSGNVNGASYTGGLMGYAFTGANECFSVAKVVGTANVGGFCGTFDMTTNISNCYAWGDVSGSVYVGGFAGNLSMGTAIYCYSTGQVNGTSNVGGFVGGVFATGPTKSFWDTSSSGQSVDGGSATGLNTAQMQTMSTFTSANWDFVGETTNGTNDYWSMGILNQNGAYPILNWQFQSLCPSTSSSINVSACGSYISPSGNYTWASSGIYMDTIPNHLGCDSIITISLTVNKITNQTITASQSASCISYSTTINTSSSEIGNNYVLRNNANNSIVAGPIYGTGMGLSFNTGVINQTTTYNVYASSNSSALNFDGVDDELIVPGSVDLYNKSFTIETWAKRTTNGTFDYIASQGSTINDEGLHIGFRDNGFFTIAFWFDDLNTTLTYTDTLWHHWAATFDAMTQKRIIYRDGDTVATGIASSNYTGTGPLHIANTAFNTGNNFAGALDEFRVWDTVRTQAEIQSNMNNCLTGTEPGLLVYYKMDEENGTTVYDKTNNNNNASLTNMDTVASWINGNVICSTCNLETSQHVTVTIKNASSSVISVSQCKSYISPSGAHTWTTSGTYIDTIPNAAGCDSIITINLTINTVNVSVSNSSPVLSANATGAAYQWIDCNNGNQPISGETNQTFTASVNGNYAVIVTQNSCSDTSACISIANSGIKNIASVNSNIYVYPNPSSGLFNVQGLSKGSKIEIYNTLGVLVKFLQADAQKTEIDLSGEANGVYLLRTAENKVIRLTKHN